LCQQEGSAEVEREQAIEELGGEIVDRRTGGVDRVVDEDIHSAKPLHRSIDQPPAVVDLHQVDLLVDRVSPEFPGERRALLRRSPAQDHLRALFGIARCDRRAQPLGAARDDGDLSRQKFTRRCLVPR
jgi:hypothetical protein